MSLNDLIINNLDIWTFSIKSKTSNSRGEGNKSELYGVKKLREMILELAIRGLIISQEKSDEPSQKILERIEIEKAQLINERKIKKNKNLLKLQDKPPFKIPHSWTWTQLGTIAEIGPKNELEDNLEVGFVPMQLISSSYIGNHGQEIRKWVEVKKNYTHFANGDIAIAKITPCFENSKAALFTNLENGFGAGTTELHIARLIGNHVNSRFILLYLKSPMFLSKGKPKMTGSAGQKRIPATFFSSNHLPLPPLKEQCRIVKKVDELMILCDQLEQEYGSTLETHNNLVSSLLKVLTSSETDANLFAATWKNIQAKFDILFTSEISIKQLKQTIIQLAVMGKLVSQNPEDEPANELLKKIDEAKAKCIKEKKIKKQKPLPKISKKEEPYFLPDNWEWIRLGDATNYGITQKIEASEVEKEIWVLELEDVEKITSRLLKKVRFNERRFKSSKNIFNKSDVIYGKLRPYLDKVVIADEPGVCTTEMIPLRGYAGILSEYLRWVMKSPYFKEYANDSTHGMNLPRMGTEKARLALIPLPPKEEQYRIVAKVNELMILCDQLKLSFAMAQTTQLKLTDSIVAKAIR